MNTLIRKPIKSRIPIKLRMAYAILRGKPVAYRLDIRNGTLHFYDADGAYVVDCDFQHATVIDGG